MASELKTTRSRASVKAFLDGVADEKKRKDARAITRQAVGAADEEDREGATERDMTATPDIRSTRRVR